MLFGLLLDDIHQTVLQSLLVFRQPILLPSVIENDRVKVVSLHAALEEPNACLVIRLLLKFQRPAVLHEVLEFVRMSAAQLFKWRLDLLFLDCSILFVFASSGKALPWERSLQQVKQDMADAFQIVTSRLLFALMSGNRCVPRCTSQVLSIFVRDVFTGTILVAFCEAKVNDKDGVPSRFSRANQEVIRFNITVDDSLCVNLLKVLHELDCNKKYGLDIQLAFT